MQIWSPGWEDPLEEGNPLQYSCLENPMGRLWSMGSQRVGHDWTNRPPPIKNYTLCRATFKVLSAIFRGVTIILPLVLQVEGASLQKHCLSPPRPSLCELVQSEPGLSSTAAAPSPWEGGVCRDADFSSFWVITCHRGSPAAVRNNGKWCPLWCPLCLWLLLWLSPRYPTAWKLFNDRDQSRSSVLDFHLICYFLIDSALPQGRDVCLLTETPRNAIIFTVIYFKDNQCKLT